MILARLFKISYLLQRGGVDGKLPYMFLPLLFRNDRQQFNILTFLTGYISWKINKLGGS